MIYVVWGAPREGKTFWVTSVVLDELRAIKKSKRHVGTHGVRNIYTNYPVISEKEGLSSQVWNPQMIYENVQDSMIVIDEAYRQFSSRNFKDFGVDTHTFFATNGHNNLDIYLIAQNPARVDVIIREMTNIFYYVRKTMVPFLSRPLWFKIYGFLDEKLMSKQSFDQAYTTQTLWFQRKVADAYNTHYFKNQNPEYVGILWSDFIKSHKTEAVSEEVSAAIEGKPENVEIENPIPYENKGEGGITWKPKPTARSVNSVDIAKAALKMYRR